MDTARCQGDAPNTAVGEVWKIFNELKPVTMAAGAVLAPLVIPMIRPSSGRAKNHVSTDTPVSIQSDSPGVPIFFTVDGSTPEEGPAHRYSGPVLLPVGRVTVRAVAVTSDGRRSSVVTKVFRVEQLQPLSEASRASGGSAQRSAGGSTSPPVSQWVEPRTESEEPRCPPSGPRFLTRRLRPEHAGPEGAGGVDGTPASRARQHAGFLRCPQSPSTRPPETLPHFSPHCGAAVPQRRPPAGGGEMLLCVFCNTLVPINTHTCLTCEENIDQQLQPQDHVVCICCGGGNPVDASSCVSCESVLQKEHVWSSSAPSGHSAEHTMICSECQRRNRHDARYCDRCGYKLSSSASHNDTCRPESPAEPSPGVMEAPPTADGCTQTAGLYYPSATALQRKEQRARGGSRPPQSAVSPGRGYWRKQLDHVCAHLRSYAQNHAPFRAVLGEPRLGRVVSAIVREEGSEVSVTASFVSVRREQTVLPKDSEVGGVTVERPISTLSSMTEDNTHGRPPKLRCDPPVEDVQLLEELGPGRGSVSAVQALLDQGAEPSCCGSDGRHALAVAVANGHCDVLPVLVQRGADVDRPSGRMKNTALHEAAVRGSDGMRCARVLLSCRANARQRNGAGQTAYDMAVKSGCVAMTRLLGADGGEELLEGL